MFGSAMRQMRISYFLLFILLLISDECKPKRTSKDCKKPVRCKPRQILKCASCVGVETRSDDEIKIPVSKHKNVDSSKISKSSRKDSFNDKGKLKMLPISSSPEFKKFEKLKKIPSSGNKNININSEGSKNEASASSNDDGKLEMLPISPKAEPETLDKPLKLSVTWESVQNEGKEQIQSKGKEKVIM